MLVGLAMLIAGCTGAQSNQSAPQASSAAAVPTSAAPTLAPPIPASATPVTGPASPTVRPTPRPTSHPTATHAGHPVCAKGYAWSKDRCLRTTVDPRPTNEFGPYVAPRVTSVRFTSCVPDAANPGWDVAVFDLTIVGGSPWTSSLQNMTQVAGSHWRWVGLTQGGQAAGLSEIVLLGNDVKRHAVTFPEVSGSCP